MPQFGGHDFALANRVSTIMKNVYLRMSLGLLITAVTALLAFNEGFVMFMVQHSWIYWGLFIAEFGIVIGVSAGISKMKASSAAALFYLFAIINGLALSMIFAAYSPGSIAKTFFITAGTFGAMSVFGYTTKQDLTKFGSFLFMALIGLIIASVVNIFWNNGTMGWIISFAGVIIFVGLTAWDTQQVKRMAEVMPAAAAGHIATLGALSLYLDFINLFLYLLRFFGSSRD
ncbi:MAG: Bax inhibitor-1/YccA family protein [Muribaculaceae bacterium]|nr:Bax inhibitor-1/YccA family protein [Muribaculaceae bacterium]MDE5912526.1 Bax inhibitor-1/YccA family protein [Muribaculaceae bacterium]MDE5971519.1 Bax inhibitor-1/YccA family protein [Muribaculaceae bacterium]MDE6461454.1 Bax inhibitor-1/YccA family protein [Muribaculaceae bacterium]MDE6509116.1 Bax inhibitor-1/YccA family protein [Muribaculaceae bacterium]